MTDNEKLIADTREHAKDPGWYPSRQECVDLADALEAAEKAHTPTDDEREARAVVRRAVGGVLFHVTNFPERAQSHLFGENMGPLNEKITDAVLGALRISEVPESSETERIARSIAESSAWDYRRALAFVEAVEAMSQEGEKR